MTIDKGPEARAPYSRPRRAIGWLAAVVAVVLVGLFVRAVAPLASLKQNAPPTQPPAPPMTAIAVPAPPLLPDTAPIAPAPPSAIGPTPPSFTGDAPSAPSSSAPSSPSASDPASFAPLASQKVKDAIYRAFKSGATQRWQDGALSGYAVPGATGFAGCRAVTYTVDQLPGAPPKSINACGE